MIRNKILATVLVAAGAAMAGASPARAQVTMAPMMKATPLHTQQPKRLKFHGEVLHMTSAAITVRNAGNLRQLVTFSYSPAIRDRMQTLLNGGGYQYGDKVTVEFMAGSDVALKIKGKPSKPR